MSKPLEHIDLEKYFADGNAATKVTRGELRYFMALLVSKDTFAEALQAFHFNIRQDIKAMVRQELKSMEAEEGSRIITL